MIRQHSIHLRDFPRASLKGAEGERGQGIWFALHAHALGIAYHRFIPDALSKLDSRHVQRLLQSGTRADPTQVASVEVLGGPALTMMGKRRRHILDSGEGRDDLPVAPERALQRRRIHDRLEHRAHLTTRLSDPIELT